MNMAVRLPILTHATVAAFLEHADPGEALIYHVGSLMHDRLLGLHFQTVHGVALAAYQAYERGEVHLVQHKIGPLDHEYIAIKRARLPDAVLGGKDRPNKSARRAPSPTAPV